MTNHILLDRLDKVRQVGRDRYTARCPAHEDKDPSLSISILPDGRTLIHCFTGCTPDDIMAAVGLNLGDLFPDGAIDHRLRGATPWLRREQQKQEQALEREQLVLDMADAMRKRGEILSDKDLKREREAFLEVRRLKNKQGAATNDQ